MGEAATAEATRVDDVRAVASLGALVARRLLERCDGAAAGALARAFKRDVSVLDFRAGGVDLLDVRHRNATQRPVRYLPGRVAVVGPATTWDREKAVREEDVRELLQRGGTLLVESTGLASSLGERRPAPRPSGPAPVDGPLVAGLAESGLSATFWIDDDASVLAGAHEVLVRATSGAAARTPLVTTGTFAAGGSFVHFASAVVPYRRASPNDAPRVTPASFAERLALPHDGPFDDDVTSMPEPLLVAQTTMLFAVARALARALVAA